VAKEAVELREIALSHMEADKTVNFLSTEEVELSNTFLRDGHVVREAESESILESVRQDVIQIAIRAERSAQRFTTDDFRRNQQAV
jgi:hypothetical protein